MLAPPHRHKRPRSPSPPSEPDLASPLDVLLKRRRRDEQLPLTLPFSSPIGDLSPFALSPNREGDYFTSQPQIQGDGDVPESSAAALRRSMAGVERRRTKHWERQNAPTQSLSHSQPTPSPSHFLTPNVRAGHSQPAPMSSSPIRNMPPSSSPFRDKTGGPDSSWMLEGGHDENEMEEEEMRREWGEEYASQNSLLHSLHLARMQSQPHPFPQHRHQLDSDDQYHHQHIDQPHPMMHPSQTPHPSQSTTVHSTPTLVSPRPHSYRQAQYPDSSPFAAHVVPNALRSSPSGGIYSPSSTGNYGRHGEDDDMGMEVLDDRVGGYGEVEDEVKRRYEETNRLLAELEVVRRRRWGEGAGGP